MRPFRLKELLPTEGDEATSLMQWAAMKWVDGHRLSNLLIMIPNGAVLAGDARARAIAMARMKRQGFKVGCPDYLLPLAKQGCYGLALELKRQKLGVVSPEQEGFAQLFTQLGWRAVICKGWEEAKDEIERYLA